MDCFIEVAEGIQLSARIWLPVGTDRPRTTILEVTPYRLHDVSAIRDSENHSYFARCGYASVRVDMRGTGNSGGSAGPMLSSHERKDTLAVADWIVRQPWSDGRIVLFGISWGAINAMYAAAERVPAIKAVVAISFYDDAFAYGLNLKGGCLTNEAVGWSAALLSYHSRPPDPLTHPSNWSSILKQRIEDAGEDLGQILLHPGRDTFWDQRTIPDPAAIDCPVLILSGLHDGNFTSAVPRALQRLGRRATAIVGPWAHRWPHMAQPGPGIDALPLIREWLDDQLAGQDPDCRTPLGRTTVWVEESRPALTYYPEARGRWMEIDNGTLEAEVERVFMTSQGLSRRPGPPDTVHLPFRGVAGGLRAGEVMPAFNAGPGPELAAEQGPDDARSLTFDSPPLDLPLTVVGRPVVHLRLKVDQPVAQICVRLCELNGSGESIRIGYGAKNLCLLDERSPALVRPDEWLDVTLPLDFCSYRFLQSSRVRVAVSSAYWPLLWPSPKPVALTLDLGRSSIDLPRLPDGARPTGLPRPMSKETLVSEIARVDLRAPDRKRWFEEHAFDRRFSLHIQDDHGLYRLDDTGIEVGARMRERYDAFDGDPLSANARASWEWSLARGEWRTRVTSAVALRGLDDVFEIQTNVTAQEGGKTLYRRRRTLRLPRRYF